MMDLWSLVGKIKPNTLIIKKNKLIEERMTN